jgi:hypothetical protein
MTLTLLCELINTTTIQENTASSYEDPTIIKIPYPTNLRTPSPGKYSRFRSLPTISGLPPPGGTGAKPSLGADAMRAPYSIHTKYPRCGEGAGAGCKHRVQWVQVLPELHVTWLSFFPRTLTHCSVQRTLLRLFIAYFSLGQP